MRNLIIASLLMGSATAANAKEIVYLECPQEGSVLNLAVDEGNSQITWTRGEKNNTVPARFTADKVMWGGGDIWVSRENLKLYLVGKESSQCKIVMPKRAF